MMVYISSCYVRKGLMIGLSKGEKQEKIYCENTENATTSSLETIFCTPLELELDQSTSISNFQCKTNLL